LSEEQYRDACLPFISLCMHSYVVLYARFLGFGKLTYAIWEASNEDCGTLGGIASHQHKEENLPQALKVVLMI
jgi:hypothetical protein